MPGNEGVTQSIRCETNNNVSVFGRGKVNILAGTS
jgi:hypothetical protein